MPKRALIVEDDKDISHLLRFHLQKLDFDVHQVYSGEEALEYLREERPDIILLDVLMPGITGLQVCKFVKSQDKTQDIPVIIMSALSEEEDIVRGLELGADDYIPKPFSFPILKARVQAVYKRYQRTEKIGEDCLEYGPLKLDNLKHEVKVGGEERKLTATEFALLKILLNYRGKVFTRSQLVNKIRGSNHAITDRSVDFQMVGLRKKLHPHSEIVESVRGVGYRLKESES
ncbi:MAG: response regulator transcription factor [Proteobacteria bacterium]|nr:response regulator transcription factor [Pseudomonadota bacterium]